MRDDGKWTAIVVAGDKGKSHPVFGKNKAFLEAYWAAYDTEGTRRTPASWSAFAYDAAGIFAGALGTGNVSREAIHDYLGNMKDSTSAYDGVVGSTYFDGEGEAAGRDFRLAVVTGGKFAAAK